MPGDQLSTGDRPVLALGALHEPARCQLAIEIPPQQPSRVESGFMGFYGPQTQPWFLHGHRGAVHLESLVKSSPICGQIPAMVYLQSSNAFCS